MVLIAAKAERKGPAVGFMTLIGAEAMRALYCI